jgi:hypothetical protein
MKERFMVWFKYKNAQQQIIYPTLPFRISKIYADQDQNEDEI